MTVAILWQPRFGHNALGETDYLGTLFEPLITLDRAWIHKTHYAIEKDFDGWFDHLTVSKVHPRWRDEFVTKVTANVLRDEAAQSVRCTIRLAGSDHPRKLTEIRISRELVQALLASSPSNFTEMPFEASRAYRNKQTIRWVGHLALPRDHDILINIPARQPKEGKGRIAFVYEQNEKSDGSLGFCEVELLAK